MNLTALAGLMPGKRAPSHNYYRMVNEADASTIDEIGFSLLRGWRYNPKNDFGVLYLSVSPKCAYQEKLKQVGGRQQDLLPQVVGKYNASLNKCLDLSDASVLASLEISVEDLVHPDDYSSPVAISREARRLGFEAIIAPSAIGADCSSLVVYKDKLNPPSYCKLEDIQKYHHK